MKEKSQKIALWAITPAGAALASRIAEMLPEETDVYVSGHLNLPPQHCHVFQGLAESVAEVFNSYRHHVFIMSTGIVVRVTAPLLKHKTIDPAVVVLDEKGRFSISLLSGHVGGANRLAQRVAQLIDAEPVITTATDVQHIPAIDILAADKDLVIENPSAIKHVSMAFLKDEPVQIYDPYGIIKNGLQSINVIDIEMMDQSVKGSAMSRPEIDPAMPGVFIDYRRVSLPSQWLILRPKSLIAGIGCNRDTEMDEIKSLLIHTLETFGLAYQSLSDFATIDIKRDESGLNSLSDDTGIPIQYFTKEALNSVQNIRQPSAAAEKYLGVKSVCEAAAILASQSGELIVSKQTTRNVTLAIARTAFLS